MNKIQVRHMRRVWECVDEVWKKHLMTKHAYKKHPKYGNSHFILSQTGGFTEAFIDNGNGKVFRETAYCSNKDIFHRKVGRRIAIGRLINTYGITEDVI